MESERRLSQTQALVMLGIVAAVLAVGTAAGLHPGATVASAVGLGAIAGVVAIAGLDRRADGRTAVDADGPGLVHHLVLELERGRRHEHPFGLVRIPAGEPGSPACREAAAAVREHLRTIDIAVAEGDSLYLVLPGADRAAAEGCVDRIAAATDLFDERDVRTASFPDDGITPGALLSVLDGAAPAVAREDLPGLDRRRRIVVDLTAVTSPVPEADDRTSLDGVDA